MKLFKQISVVIAKILLCTFLTFVSYVSRAAVISLFWEWFIHPYGPPKLSSAHSLGISLFFAVPLVNIKKNDGSFLIHDVNKDGFVLQFIVITAETILRLMVIYMFGLVVHLVKG